MTYLHHMANVEHQEPTWTIQERMRKARKHGGFKTQRDLAAAIGTSEATVTRYESGATTVLKPLILRQWALACGVPYEWLVGQNRKILMGAKVAA